jgi:hypothetical protein
MGVPVFVPVFVSVGLLVLGHEHNLIWRRLALHAGFTATTAYFIMDVAAIWMTSSAGTESGLIHAEAAAVPLFSLRDPRPPASTWPERT